MGLDVAQFVGFHPGFEEVAIWLVPDGQEEAVDGDVGGVFVLHAFLMNEVCTLHAICSEKSGDIGLEEDFDVRRFRHTGLHGLRGTEEGLSDDEVNLLREASEIGGFFAGCVSATNNGHGLLAIEKAVTRGAGAHASSAIFGFIGEAEIFGCGARGDDEGVALHGGVVVKFNDIGASERLTFVAIAERISTPKRSA